MNKKRRVKKYKLIIFDFDGVLSDSLLVCMEEINHLVRVKFKSIPEVNSQEDMAKVYSVKLRHSLRPFGVNEEQTNDFFDLHSLAMEQRSNEIEPFYKVVVALSTCRIPQVIITSSYSNAVQVILTKCKDYNESIIQHIYGRELQKTKTEKIKQALDDFRICKPDALYIGDLVSDIIYCRDVPIDIACVGYGYHPANYIKGFSPNYLLEDQESLITFLTELQV